MPYESYTNDSDAIFAQQLDSMKLSETAIDPSYSSLGANVAVSNLGLDRQYGLDTKSKMAYHQQGMATRQAISEDRSKAFEASEYKDAMDRLRNEMTGDLMTDTMLFKEIGQKYAGNKLVADALAGMQSSANMVAQAKGQAFLNKKAEIDMSLFDEDQYKEASLNEQNAILLESKERIARAQAMEGATEADIATRRAEFAGHVGAVDKELGARAAVLIGMKEELGIGDDVINMMTNMLGSVMQSDGLDNAVKKNLGNHLPAIQSIEAAGINLREVSDEEAINKIVENAKKTAPAGMTKKAEILMREKLQASISAYRENDAISQMKDTIVQKMRDSLPADPSKMTEDERKSMKQNFLRLQNEMYQVNGHISKMENDYKYRMDQQKSVLELQKEMLDITKKTSDMDISKRRIAVAEKIVAMKEKTASEGQFVRAWNLMDSSTKKELFGEFLQEKGLTLNKLDKSDISIQDLLVEFAFGHAPEEGGDAFASLVKE